MRWLSFRKLLPYLLATGVLAALGYAFWPRPIPVDLATVARGPLEVTVDEEGKTRIKERYVVSAPLTGRLRRIELDPGDPVVAGETLLAVIEPSDPALLDARALAETHARVKAAEASFQQAGPNLERGRVALEFAQAEHRRIRQLAERQNASQQELENAELLVRTRTEELKAAQFALRIAEFELEQAQAALIRSRPDTPPSTADDSAYIAIRAPISGRVLHVFQKSAGVVAAGASLIELGDPNDLEIEIDVLSSDAIAIQPGGLVRLEHWGGDHPLNGRVRLVEPAAFTKVSALGVEEQRVNVVVDFTDPLQQRTTLGDGYRVEARIITWTSPDVLKVPSSSLFRDGTDWAVFRVRNNRAELAHLKLGHNNGLEAEVLGGLNEGDVVIPHPTDKLSAGVAITRR